MAYKTGHLNTPYHEIYLKYLLSAISKENLQLSSDANDELNEFENCIFNAVLSDMIHQVGVLNHGKTVNNLSDRMKPLRMTRFQAPILTDLYDEHTLQPFHEALQAMSDTKLENDLANIRELLQKCLMELKTTGTFDHLKDYVIDKTVQAFDEYQLINDYMESSMKFKALTDRWKRLKKIDHKLTDHLEQFDTESDDKRNELKRIHTMEQNMVRKWEESRIEQVTDVFKYELVHLEGSADDLHQRSSDDKLTTERLKVYNECKYKRIENAIEYWTERCTAEKKTLGEEIKRTKANNNIVWSKYETIRDSYKERETFIENYRVEQKLLQNQREHEMRQRKCAVNIQAWWRGTMVRKCLGPYRPKKKKGKKTGKN